MWTNVKNLRNYIHYTSHFDEVVFRSQMLVVKWFLEVSGHSEIMDIIDLYEKLQHLPHAYSNVLKFISNCFNITSQSGIK